MEALDFFEGLEADNSKTYWTEHKATYDERTGRRARGDPPPHCSVLALQDVGRHGRRLRTKTVTRPARLMGMKPSRSSIARTLAGVPKYSTGRSFSRYTT